MNILVIGSCTKAKNIRNCAGPLTQADFDAPSVLQRREAELSAWALPARELYTGWQHRYMMNGVKALRGRFGSSACSLKIVSAGYGLVDEEQRLVPYEATFQGRPPKWIHERSNRLGIPTAMRKAVIGYDAVMFLLGKNYLISTHPPLAPELKQRFIFFTSEVGLAFHSNSTILPAGPKETRFGAAVMTLKGKMFELLALGLCGAPDRWDELLSDKTECTGLALISEGQKNL
jgi:hypothetical protein